MTNHSIAVTIYHNPGCSKSRTTLELIQARGIEPKIVHYLKNPPAPETLTRLATLLDVPLEDIVRKAEAEFVDAGSSVPLGDEHHLAEWINQHPRVMQRPIVVNEDTGAAVVGRPPENVLNILGNL